MVLKESKEFQEQLDQERSKLVRLQEDLTGVERRIDEINSAISAERERSARDAVGDAARKVIAGEALDTFRAPHFDSVLEALYRQRRILSEAVKMQRVTVDQASNRFSAAAGQELRPQYKKRVGAIAQAVVALSQAVMAESAFRDQLNKDGIVFGVALGNGMTFSKVGHLGDRYSRAEIYLRELVDERWFTEAEIEAMKKA